ncbi:MAG: beta-galactosidase GalB [Pyrinomonadaceae bacterium]
MTKKPKTISRINGLALVCIMLLGFASASFGQETGRSNFNENWRFQKNDPAGSESVLAWDKVKDWVVATGNEYVVDGAKPTRPSGNLGDAVAYTTTNFNDAAWRNVNLPHDWGIEGDFQQALQGETGKRPWAGIGWYRKHFNVPATDKDKQIYIDFEGAMSHSAVWLNGKFVGGWPYGYASFRLDLTPYIEFGKENVIAVRLDNPDESSRWYPGSGLYRNVWLVKTAPVHVGKWGTFVKTSTVSNGSATVNVKIAIENDADAEGEVTVRTSIYRLANGVKGPKPVAAASKKITLDRNDSTVDLTTDVRDPALWSPSSPTLYRAVTEIVRVGHIIDRYETNFGIRTVKFDAVMGLLINGEHVYVQGVCNHHDLGALGTAINIRALERQLEILKSFGVNAIRTSHNPPAPELLDLADKMGILILDEAFDAWTGSKKKNDYATLFKDWHEKDLRAFIRRDRNHPSVIAWSTGNEIREQRPEGHPVSVMLAKIVHEEDPTRLVTVGANGADSSTNGFQNTVDVFGFNYKPHLYTKFHTDNPNKPVWSTESASTISSRGEYYFPVSNDKSKGFFDFQVSSYDLYAPPWATPPDAEFAGQDKTPAVAGEFVWTGFDYLGEPTPYDRDASRTLNFRFTDPAEQSKAEETIKAGNRITVPSRSSYFGIVDLAGFPKDRFYIYQARWRPNLPMAHILPHWNWPDRKGQVTPVHVYTSGDEAELFLNGRSLGRKKIGQYEYRLRWDDVIYEPGELKVIAYKNGNKWAEDVVKTTDAASQISLTADRSNIKADGSDLSFITVKIIDKNGLVVPKSNNRIKFSITGPGEIIAVDNGDAIDHDSFQRLDRRAYNGMALVIVRSLKGKAGKVVVTASAEGLKGSAINISTAGK